MRLLFELRSLVEGAVWGFVYLNFFFFISKVSKGVFLKKRTANTLTYLSKKKLIIRKTAKD